MEVSGTPRISISAVGPPNRVGSALHPHDPGDYLAPQIRDPPLPIEQTRTFNQCWANVGPASQTVAQH